MLYRVLIVQVIEQHKRSSLPGSSLAEVCLVMGDMKDGLGLRADSHQLWQQALKLSQQESHTVGLRERQVH